MLSKRFWLVSRTLASPFYQHHHVRHSSNLSIPPTKLTQSYYHHGANTPLLYHTVGQNLDLLAAEHPNQQCYIFKGEGNKRYTYKSFLDEVDGLATSLIDLGFEKNDRLGVWLPNTSENCALSYAASKVGVIKVKYDLAILRTFSRVSILFLFLFQSRSILIQPTWTEN